MGRRVEGSGLWWVGSGRAIGVGGRGEGSRGGGREGESSRVEWEGG